jgi:hypothetical protein
VLPQLTPLNGALAGSPVQVPPPPKFHAPVGTIKHVSIRPRDSYFKASGKTAAQKAGLAYEEKVQEYLVGTLSKCYLPAPYVDFKDATGPRTCIPDGILFTSSGLVIFEIKSQHMPEAWWQLRRLYEPVLRCYLNTYGIRPDLFLLEICKSYDPQMPFPERPTLVYDIQSFLDTAKDKEFGVFRWKP